MGRVDNIPIAVTRILDNGNIIIQATGDQRKRQWVVLPDLYSVWVAYIYEKWMEGPDVERPRWAPKTGTVEQRDGNSCKGRDPVVFTFSEDVTAKKQALIDAFNDRIAAFEKSEHEALEQALRELE